MNRFNFAMQKILDLREFEEEQAQIELGRLIAESERIKRLLEQIAAEKARIVAGSSGETDIKQMIVREHYMTRLDIHRDELLAELVISDAAIEKQRTVFAEAMKNRKVLSNLKDRQLIEYKKDMQYAEDTAIDDAVSTRYATDERRTTITAD